MAAAAAAAGYSGKPLAAKLGVEPGMRVLLVDAPGGYPSLLGPRTAEVTFTGRAGPAVDLVHAFFVERARLAAALTRWRAALRPEVPVWVSWPKKAAKVPTDITEDVIRGIALPLGWVDVKVCAVDERWSGLKLVVRRELRTTP